MATERKEGEGYWQRTESLNSVTATQKHRKAEGLNLIHLCWLQKGGVNKRWLASR